MQFAGRYPHLGPNMSSEGIIALPRDTFQLLERYIKAELQSQLGSFLQVEQNLTMTGLQFTPVVNIDEVSVSHIDSSFHIETYSSRYTSVCKRHTSPANFSLSNTAASSSTSLHA